MALFAIVWLAWDIAPGVNQWNIQVKDIGPFFYVCLSWLAWLSSTKLMLLQYTYVGSIMYGISIFFIKLSILLQYLRIFVPLNAHNTMYWTSHALIWTNLLFYLVETFVVAFDCKPIGAWGPTITTRQSSRCLDFNVAAGTLNSISDMAILILPQLTIWRLHMALREKVHVSAIFLTGFLSVRAI